MNGFAPVPLGAVRLRGPMIQTLFGSLDEEPKAGLFERMKQAVSRTRENLSERIDEVVCIPQGNRPRYPRRPGSHTDRRRPWHGHHHEVLNSTARKSRPQADQATSRNSSALLKEELLAILQPRQRCSRCKGGSDTPEVILVVGVNGTGKTTTIGKLAQRLARPGQDGAALRRRHFPRRRHRATGSLGRAHRHRSDQDQARRRSRGRALRRPAGRQRARKTDYVIVDTAGRLHTKTNLMDRTAKRCAAPRSASFPARRMRRCW